MSKFFERRVETGTTRWWAGVHRCRERRVKENNWKYRDLMFVNSWKIPVPPPERRKPAAKVNRRIAERRAIHSEAWYTDYIMGDLGPMRRRNATNRRKQQEKPMKEGRPFDLEAAKAGAKFYSTSDPRGLKLRHYTLLAVSKRGVIVGELDDGCTITGDRAGFRMVPVTHVEYTQVHATTGRLSMSNTMHTTPEACADTIKSDGYTVARVEWES